MRQASADPPGVLTALCTGCLVGLFLSMDTTADGAPPPAPDITSGREAGSSLWA